MDPELEIAAVASAGGLLGWRPRRVAPPGTPCANCATPLQGPWCHACGQLAEDFERSVWSLVGEAVEHFFDADGRIFHTLPRLILRPASLTREYLAGKRAPQMPPLRLFLVVIVAFFLAGSLRDLVHPSPRPIDSPSAASHGVSGLNLVGDPRLRAVGKWLIPRLAYTSAHPREFGDALESWAHRAAVIFLPISTLLLALLFIFRRRVFIFDHAIFSMHSLSFMGSLATALTLLGLVPVIDGISGLLVFAAPVHLFAHMRGVYRTSIPGTLARMFLLLVFSAIAAFLLFLGVMAWELATLPATGP
ncbi:MAG TPA: DUF3667 domain-containing protein [Caulobacteraceae bacterium]|nr:DUF3667 domain-containing protein [Caulobacteraceae bacterium]